MKTCQSAGFIKRAAKISMLCSATVLAIATAALAFTAPNSINQCYDCHGSPQIPNGNDIRPIDSQVVAGSAFRNISTGAVIGNHRNHMPAATTVTTVCTPCHGPAPTAMDHRNGKINMRQHINSTASIRGTYNKGVFFNQTSAFDGTNAKCSNVNCHFQKQTLSWGSSAYSYTSASVNNCDDCHGNGAGLAAPQDGSHPSASNKHGLYYGSDTLSCAKCHADHTAETYKFAHATSAGNRALILKGTDFPATATYSLPNNLNYPAYMNNAPAARIGNCSNFYCHSPGTASTKLADGRTIQAPAATATWGSTVTCASCHTGGTSAGPTYATSVKANLHPSHTKTGVAFTCDVCHFKTTSNGTTITSIPRHVDGYYNISANTSKIKPFNYTYATTGGSCSKSTCHGSYTPNWGMTFNPTSGNQCQKCHGSQTAAFTNVSGASVAPGTGNIDTGRVAGSVRGGMHQEHLTATAGFTDKIHCGECHVVVTNVKDATHMQYTTSHPVFNGTLAPAKGHTPSAVRTAGQIVCNNTYCHTGNLNSGTSPSPSWNDTAYISATPTLTDCNRCHGLPPRKTFGHASTAVITTFGQIATLCSGCHNTLKTTGATSFATVFTDVKLHMNGNPDAVGGHAFPYGGSVHMPTGTGNPLANAKAPYTNCSGCHDTTSTVGTYTAATVKPVCTGCHTKAANFQGATPGCYDCHGSSATVATPNGSITSFPNYSGTHSKHVGGYKLMVCNDCHANGGSGNKNHGSSNRVPSANMSFVHVSSATKAFHATLTTTTATCSASYCHSDVQSSTGGARTAKTVVWGTHLNCAGCHGNTNTTLISGSHPLHLTAGLTCDDCHGTAGAAANTSIHADGSVNVVLTLNGASATYSGDAIPGNSNFGNCSNTTCHGSTAPSPTWGANSNNYICTKCHGTATAGTTATPAQMAPTTPAAAAHAIHFAGTMGAATACQECHESVTSVGTAGHMDGIKTIIFNGPVSTATTVAPTNSLAGCATTWCHGGDTTRIPQNSPARTTPVWGTAFPTTSTLGTGGVGGTSGTGRCAQCHGFPPLNAQHAGKTLTGATGCFNCHTNVTTAGTIVDPKLHVDGIIQGGSCTGCHAAGGSGNTNGRAAAVADFTGNGNSHHYQGTAAIDGTTCYACHWEADSVGAQTTHHNEQTAGFRNKVQLVVWGTSTTRPTAYTAGTTYVLYSSGRATNSTRTEIAKLNAVCIGCHNTTNAARFSNDGNAPNKYAWDATSIDARYSQTGTTTWGKITNNTATPKTAVKAFSAHGQATKNQRGWSTVVDTFPVAAATSNVMCFDCHNSHGSTTPLSGVTSSYSSATGRRKGAILKDVTAKEGGYSLTYKSAAGGTTAQKNVYNPGAGLCFDCHNTATASTTIPWGYTSTFGFTPPAAQGTGRGVIGYWDTPHFGDAGANFISTMTFAYKAGKSINQGGHFGASTGLNTSITKRSFDPGTPNGNVIQGLCTPCHDPHGNSPSVATAQAYSVPMLKGTWVTSPYRQDGAPSATNVVKGSTSGSVSTGSNAGYRLDQNTMAANGTVANGLWTWANATTLQTTNDTQFAGLCIGCHAKTAINSSAAAASSNWKTMGRIHNSVKGWASTAGGNANNATHAYTCSKCHTPHNSRLPRLLVTNCLDVKHRGRVSSGGNMSVALSGAKGSSSGMGRFPGGGGGTSGGYFFGTTGSAATKTCHDSATAGGATFSTAAELWNTKSPW